MGQKSHSPGRLHASWLNNYRCCILWHLETVSTNYSKQKESNVVTRRMLAPRQRADHSAHVTTALLEKFKWDILDLPPYRPSLAPRDSHLFLHLKTISLGKSSTNDQLQEEVTTWFKRQAADFYDSGIKKLVPRLNKYLDNSVAIVN
jgi:hypothetical protein